MVKLGGFLGAVLALAAVFVFTEWLYVDTFASNVGDTVEVVIATAAVALGALLGSSLARRYATGRRRRRPA